MAKKRKAPAQNPIPNSEDTHKLKTPKTELIEEEKPVENNPVGKNPIEKNPVGKSVIEKNPVEKSAIEKNPVGKSVIEKNPVGKSVIEKNPDGKSVSEKNPDGKSVIEKNPVGKSVIEKNPVGKSSIEKNPVGKSVIEKNPDGKSVIEKNPVGKSVIEKNPVGENPVEENPDEEIEESEESESEDSSDEESEESDEETTIENLKKLLEPFSKDQLIDFIKEAALKDPSILSSIATSAESDPARRKIFVFGLGWDATSAQLLAAFEPFGEVEECKLVTDKVTGRAKGYAFLQFKELKSAKRALKVPQKKIGNRVTTCQLASAGGASGGVPPEGRKLYVGNVGPQVSPEKIKSFFANYGEIEEGPIGIDSNTGKFKGYTIFVFKNVEGLKKALEEPNKIFEGVQLQCRPANKNPPAGAAAVTPPVGPSVGSAVVQSQQPSGVNYNLGGFNPTALMNPMMGQGVGLTNPLMGLSGNGFGPSMGFGLGGMGPSMIAGYNNPQAALQAMSAYGAQMGQSSAGATPVAGVGTRPMTGLGPAGNMYPSFRR